MKAVLAVLILAAAPAEDAVLRSNWKKIRVTEKFYSEGAHAGDFNKDGRMDIVAGPYWVEGPDFTKIHEYYPAKAFDPNGYSDNFFAFTHDFNADGWTDILVYSFPGKDASWYENPQGKDGPWKKTKLMDVVDNESPTFEDVDGDKVPDIVCSTGGHLGYFSLKDSKFHPISPKAHYQKFTHGLGLGDVNGDGRKDFLEKDGWWEQPASLAGDPVWKFNKVPLGRGGAQMYAYDVDGDGLNDIVTSIEAHNHGLSWFKQAKEGDAITFKEQVIIGKKESDNRYGIKFTQMHAVDLVDMDGDGLKDIVTGKRYWAHGPKGDADPGAPAVLYWFKLVRGPNGVDFVPFKIDDDSGIGTQVLATDLNGDGYPDVVVGNKKGIFVHLGEVRKVSKEEFEKALPKPAGQ
jgi:hypothetical protein